MRSILLAAAAVVAVPALAADQPATGADKSKRVCRSEPVTGSRFPLKTCRTERQWEARSEAHRRAAQELIDRPAIGGSGD